MLKRAYFTRGEKVGGFFACLKIIESSFQTGDRCLEVWCFKVF